MGVGKIGWELVRILTKDEVGIWMEISLREIWDWNIWYWESMSVRMKRRVVILVGRVIWNLRTTVLEDNKKYIET